MITDTENLWIDDLFFSDLEELINSEIMWAYDEPEDIPDDFRLKVNCSELEPIVRFTNEGLVEKLYEETLEMHPESELMKERLIADWKEAGIADFINEKAPKWNVSSNRSFVLTKEDIVKHFKETQNNDNSN